jgi:hypothetical protein
MHYRTLKDKIWNRLPAKLSGKQEKEDNPNQGVDNPPVFQRSRS